MKRELFEYTCSQCGAVIVQPNPHPPNCWLVFESLDFCSTPCVRARLDRMDAFWKRVEVVGLAAALAEEPEYVPRGGAKAISTQPHDVFKDPDAADAWIKFC